MVLVICSTRHGPFAKAMAFASCPRDRFQDCRNPGDGMNGLCKALGEGWEANGIVQLVRNEGHMSGMNGF